MGVNGCSGNVRHHLEASTGGTDIGSGIGRWGFGGLIMSQVGWTQEVLAEEDRKGWDKLTEVSIDWWP